MSTLTILIGVILSAASQAVVVTLCILGLAACFFLAFAGGGKLGVITDMAMASEDSNGAAGAASSTACFFVALTVEFVRLATTRGPGHSSFAWGFLLWVIRSFTEAMVVFVLLSISWFALRWGLGVQSQNSEQVGTSSQGTYGAGVMSGGMTLIAAQKSHLRQSGIEGNSQPTSWHNGIVDDGPLSDYLSLYLGPLAPPYGDSYMIKSADALQ